MRSRAVRTTLTLDEDVAAKVRAAFTFGNRAIVRVWIIDPQREMVAAVRIEGGQAIDSLWHLKVART